MKSHMETSPKFSSRINYHLKKTNKQKNKKQTAFAMSHTVDTGIEPTSLCLRHWQAGSLPLVQ